jgi:hypothetical protein
MLIDGSVEDCMSLYDLNCSFRTLNLACSTHEAFFRFHSYRLSVLHLIDTHGASFRARSATGAFVVVNNYFDHSFFPFMLNFH